ncbi:acetoacetate--CoA ligase [Sciscionella marina]|uniref:acetoacetate--CoA ligase n=1 Tax=Sciscionella marina TaxID=508770 RepID=UPI00036B22A1|nr:acetoacetate--CoA ligase [Sciscionella marina]
MDGDILWTPPADARQTTKMGRFMSNVAERHGVVLETYEDFWKWSVDNLEDFHAHLVHFCDVRFTEQPTEVLTSRVVPDARWFPGATLNFAEHIIRALPEGTVITGVSEVRDTIVWSNVELRAQVGRIRRGLVELGVTRGDVVGGYLPHIPETIAAFLATASLGAIWAVCPPEFGVNSVVDRLGQVDPKVLLAVDGYRFGGKDFDRREQVATIRSALPSVETLVWLPYLGDEIPQGARSWHDVFGADGEVEFDPVPFDHTLYVLYTSGTTALPKAIPHSHGGPLLEHHKWLGLQADLCPGDTFFWFSTTGWIVWNLAVSALLTGAATVTFDGNPIYPDLRRQWKLIEDLGITHFGASTAFLMGCARSGLKPSEEFDLSSVRSVLVGGSPFPASGWEWFYAAVKPDVMVGCSCGGTDVAGTFIGGSPLVPARAGRHACVYLGVDVQVWDEGGQQIVGKPGELVVTTPLPSMPKALWGKDGESRLFDTYYSTFDGVWDQHDWAIFYEDGSSSVVGRSDATLNRSGVRFGPPEYYAVLESLPEVQEALVVHLQDRNVEAGEIVAFVMLAPGYSLDKDLEAQINERLASSLSPRHVPDALLLVADIPKTLTGKKLEVPVRRILEGASAEEVTSAGTLANPDAIDEFVRLAEQRRGRVLT